MRPIAPTAKENMLESMRYTADFLLKVASAPSGAMIFGETAVQLVRTCYIYQKGQFLTGGVGDAFDELSLPLTPEEKTLLVGIEKAMRMEEDYLELLPGLEPGRMTQIAQKLREALK